MTGSAAAPAFVASILTISQNGVLGYAAHVAVFRLRLRVLKAVHERSILHKLSTVEPVGGQRA